MTGSAVLLRNSSETPNEKVEVGMMSRGIEY